MKRAAATGKIDAALLRPTGAEIRRAASLIRGLPADRGGRIVVSLSELGPFVGRLTAPRALAVFGQLTTNDDWFAKRGPPAPKTDITDADGIVYRYFAGRCFEFHPLANFGALNAHVAAGNTEATPQLADALVARGIYKPGGGVALGVLLPVLRRPAGRGRPDGAGRRRAGVRARGDPRPRRRPPTIAPRTPPTPLIPATC